MKKTLILLLVLPSLLFSQEIKENIEAVPFAMIENVPIYPGCDKVSNEKKRRKCLSERIAKFVQKEFNTSLAGGIGLYGRQRISVIFKIDTFGRATQIRARAPHFRLEKEAIRVVKMLPIMKPGTQDGKKVIVPYSLPIVFEVN